MLRWREERRERGEVGCKLTTSLDTRTEKLYERDKWAMY
jgi:hypothetical protein